MKLLCLLVMLASAQATPKPLATATRGITGTVTITTDAGVVRGRPDLDLDAPLLVRVAGMREGDDGQTTYELEFIGTDAGTFDLREVLTVGDAANAEALAAIPIEIVTNLQTDAASDLVISMPPSIGLTSGYVDWLIAIGVVWILIPVAFIIRSAMRPRPKEAPPEVEPTIAEQLEPLVTAAAARSLSVSEKGRLELMLYWFWQERLGLCEARPAAVVALRNHESAGSLLRAVESWLHNPDAPQPSRGDIAQLLEPYAGTTSAP
ncbi:MAG: hypothetical protein QGG74_02895 [Phycisphaerales bacterium]|jgi:hypothetical protein|nr:hypothetical protein [Phycisphaerales bacterium]